MNNFMQRFRFFMQDRYGFDQLNFALLITSLIVSIISGFIFVWNVRLIFRLIDLALLVIVVLRFLSKNIDARARENMKFHTVWDKISGWFKFQNRRFRDGQTHRYYHCPSCKAQLRVKNIKGKHTIRCPRCGAQFEKKIR